MESWSGLSFYGFDSIIDARGMTRPRILETETHNERVGWPVMASYGLAM